MVSVCLSVCLSLCLSNCLSICLSAWLKHVLIARCLSYLLRCQGKTFTTKESKLLNGGLFHTESLQAKSNNNLNTHFGEYTQKKKKKKIKSQFLGCKIAPFRNSVQRDINCLNSCKIRYIIQ